MAPALVPTGHCWDPPSCQALLLLWPHSHQPSQTLWAECPTLGEPEEGDRTPKLMTPLHGESGSSPLVLQVVVWRWMQLRGIPVLGRGCRCGIPLWGLSTHPGCFPGTQQYTAEESGNVSVQCHYKIADYGDVSKAWCKKEEGETCNVLVATSSEPPGGHSTAREGSVRIQDDTQQGIVTITMEQLQVQDSGVYWCALQESSGLSRMEEVTLNVSKGGYGSIGTRSEIPDSCPCSLPLHCPAYPTSHLACVCLPKPYGFGPSHGHHPAE